MVYTPRRILHVSQKYSTAMVLLHIITLLLNTFSSKQNSQWLSTLVVFLTTRLNTSTFLHHSLAEHIKKQNSMTKTEQNTVTQLFVAVSSCFFFPTVESCNAFWFPTIRILRQKISPLCYFWSVIKT